MFILRLSFCRVFEKMMSFIYSYSFLNVSDLPSQPNIKVVELCLPKR